MPLPPPPPSASRPPTRRPTALPVWGVLLACLVIVLGLVGAGWLVLDRASHSWQRLACGQGGCPAGDRVVRVIDGDTIEVVSFGRTETVRLIGIDTPETHHPTKPVGCYGPEAAARTTELLPVGTRVRLERDAETHDTYGRLLAYVIRADDGMFVNLELAREGYAQVLSIAPNTAHSREFLDAVAEARRQGRGLWSACPPPP